MCHVASPFVLFRFAAALLHFCGRRAHLRRRVSGAQGVLTRGQGGGKVGGGWRWARAARATAASAPRRACSSPCSTARRRRSSGARRAPRRGFRRAQGRGRALRGSARGVWGVLRGARRSGGRRARLLQRAPPQTRCFPFRVALRRAPNLSPPFTSCASREEVCSHVSPSLPPSPFLQDDGGAGVAGAAPRGEHRAARDGGQGQQPQRRGRGLRCAHPAPPRGERHCPRAHARARTQGWCGGKRQRATPGAACRAACTQTRTPAAAKLSEAGARRALRKP